MHALLAFARMRPASICAAPQVGTDYPITLGRLSGSQSTRKSGSAVASARDVAARCGLAIHPSTTRGAATQRGCGWRARETDLFRSCERTEGGTA